jgi:hypothetical protein
MCSLSKPHHPSQPLSARRYLAGEYWWGEYVLAVSGVWGKLLDSA